MFACKLDLERFLLLSGICKHVRALAPPCNTGIRIISGSEKCNIAYCEEYLLTVGTLQVDTYVFISEEPISNMSTVTRNRDFLVFCPRYRRVWNISVYDR